MAQIKVSLTKCDDYEPAKVRAALLRHFELLGGLQNFVSRGDKVLIKPNLIAPKPPRCATQTNPVVITELAKILLDFGAKPFVGDSPAWANTAACTDALGITEPLKKLGVPVKQLRKPVPRTLEHSGAKIGISSIALEADRIINLPKLKTHQQIAMTIAVKNIFGCVSGKAKAIWHFRKGGSFDDFCTMLLDIYKMLAPAMTIVDAIVVMEGPGPINGNPRKLGYLVASADPIAAEIICCDLVGFPSEKLPLVATARKIGFGCTNRQNIQVIGDALSADMPIRLVPAELTPLRFAPWRIVKSILKQIFMLIKSKSRS